MTQSFDALKLGDALMINDVLYFAAGKVTLRTPDDSVWNEWLLCPKKLTAANALESFNYKWLAYDAELGLTLWSPANLSTQIDVNTLSKGKTIAINGDKYRAIEIDEARVIECIGDVGDDCKAGEKFFYADMRGAGTVMLSLEWNSSGQEVMLGRRIPGANILNWAKAAGTNLAARIPSTSYKRASYTITDRERTSESFFSGIAIIFVFGAAVLLESCDGDEDCTQKYNVNTGQYETVCSDGVRTQGGRGFMGWGGK
jgi:hypothetical protein